MIRVCHLLDESAAWHHRVGVSQLLDRLDRTEYTQSVVALGGAGAAIVKAIRATVRIVPQMGALDFLSAPLFRRLLDQIGVDVVHAWGSRAAKIAVAATQVPVVVELFDPSLAARDAMILRSLDRSIGLAVVCDSERLRRLLAESGVSPDLLTVVRPGVDFSKINRVQRSGLRNLLGLSREDYVVTTENSVPRGEQLDVVIAAGLLSHLEPRTKMIIAGSGRTSRSIARFASGENEHLYRYPANHLFEDILAIADTMVIASRGEVCTTAIAWAMASNTAVIAPAVYSVAELIGSGLNGILYKHEPDRPPSVAIARLLNDRTKQEKVKQVARGHAYEVFGVRRRIDQIKQVYRNLREGIAPGMGIVDSAAR